MLLGSESKPPPAPLSELPAASRIKEAVGAEAGLGVELKTQKRCVLWGRLLSENSVDHRASSIIHTHTLWWEAEGLRARWSFTGCVQSLSVFSPCCWNKLSSFLHRQKRWGRLHGPHRVLSGAVMTPPTFSSPPTCCLPFMYDDKRWVLSPVHRLAGGLCDVSARRICSLQTHRLISPLLNSLYRDHLLHSYASTHCTKQFRKD